MKSTSILSLKSWTSKIHPPLPRTPRETEQLHAALTSSFRRQLDQQFPPVQSTPSTGSQSRIGPNDGQPHSAPRSSAQSTDSHMRNILNHPLFSQAPPRNPSSLSRESTNTQLDSDGRLAKEPMASFDNMVALGTADYVTVRRCLKAQFALSSASSKESIREQMKRSGAGSRVVAWLWAADSESRKLFFGCRATIALVMKFMAAENLQRLVFMWLRMLQKNDVGGLSGDLEPTEARTLQKHLLSELVAAEISYGGGIVSALAYYKDAYELLSDPNVPVLSNETYPGLRSAGYYLARWIVEHKGSPEVKAIPVETFDQFSQIANRFTRRPQLWSASIQLCHPTQPTYKPILAYLKEQSSKDHSSWSPQRREITLNVSLGAAQLSLTQERYSDATWLAKYSKKLLPDEQQIKQQLSPRLAPQPSTAQEDLLNRLDLALS
ncbi:Saccharopine dehydrogenase [Arachnomyces sp. PD_36]|nr:Saccharopine dehydrogenase [Arachnomyces sp. PD_36]